MSVYVVVPVFNRLALTKSLVGCMRKQALNQQLRLIIVNDGSTDGTAQWLAAQNDEWRRFIVLGWRCGFGSAPSAGESGER
jgi:glycosyltransferase involved in cell wall biosynthesis